MKIKKIESICKARKTIFIYDTLSIQWISNGQVYYPLYKFPSLNEDNVFAMFDIPEDKQSKFQFGAYSTLPPQFDFSDTTDNEEMILTGNLLIQKNGYLLLPLKTQFGLIFIDTRYLAPFDDIEEGVQLYQRIDQFGKTYIAVKSGFSLFGIILPLDNIIDDKLIAEFEELTSLSKVALKNKQE